MKLIAQVVAAAAWASLCSAANAQGLPEALAAQAAADDARDNWSTPEMALANQTGNAARAARDGMNMRLSAVSALMSVADRNATRSLLDAAKDDIEAGDDDFNEGVQLRADAQIAYVAGLMSMMMEAYGVAVLQFEQAEMDYMDSFIEAGFAIDDYDASSVDLALAEQIIEKYE